MQNHINVALIGNPNTGKTSLFNQLTGLNQKVGNYPGVTVDKKQGTSKLSKNSTATITDLPGTYSINPTSLDESIVFKWLQNKNNKNYPDVLVIVADVENLKRNLLLFSQVQDLEIPTVLALNMEDEMTKKGITIDLELLEKELKTKIVLLSARNNTGIDNLKNEIENYKEIKQVSNFDFYSDKIDANYFEELKNLNPNFSVYQLWLMITQNNFEGISNSEKETLLTFKQDVSLMKKYQHKETIYRYQKINEVLKKTYNVDKTKATDLRSKLDKIFTHKIFGYLIFFGILLLIFQSIFEWATVPMDYIDETFANFSSWLKITYQKEF